MKNPVATYRVQLSPEYTFEDLEAIIDYLEDLGVSTIYSAPFFQAREGSSHGYDIIDPFKINKEIGRLDTFIKISKKLQRKNMNWLQDIVPNHMAFDGENVWLRDIFELGPESSHYHSFDINWEDGEKIMAPFLGTPLKEVLQKKELELRVSKRGFSIHYFDQEYSASAESYKYILNGNLGEKREVQFNDLSGKKENWEELKEYVVRQLQNDPDFERKIEKSIAEINTSEEKFKNLLDLQYFLPCHWKETEKHINYRRFFTINDLICLRMEDEKVFEEYHRFIFQLCEEKLIHGLRIDHVDGLFDPKAYLQMLRKRLGSDFYIIIEKILEWDEKLPVHWPVQGTSGYGFLATVNQVLTNAQSENQFVKAYHAIDPKNADYHDLIFEQKTFILKQRMGGEYENLWRLAVDLELLDKDAPTQKEALGMMLASFPVYRIYPEDYPLKKRQKKIIESAYNNALNFAPSLENELNKVRDLFLGNAQKDLENMLFFLQRCQQFTGPLAAKGVEDTAFYKFNELISHNEVGDSPEHFGLSVEDFHQRMQLRLDDFPLSINATATHDTKRGEDSRMRINVLSEIAPQWFEKVKEWKAIGENLKQKNTAPDDNESYFIFQMLIGAWPFNAAPDEVFFERSKAYLQKVLREAKEHSSWAAPNEEYEEQVYAYLQNLIKNEDFLESFGEFQSKIATFGAIKSLSQLLLKITTPGIPDIYQGTELWDLSYVDPDNRRPVDYNLRIEYLEEIKNFTSKDLPHLKQNFANAKIKMYSLHKALKVRKAMPEVFEEGSYMPLVVKGADAGKILAFARKKGSKTVVVVLPLLVTSIFSENLELQDAQPDIQVLLPEDFSGDLKNEFTGRIFESKKLSVAELFKDFPIALLTNET